MFDQPSQAFFPEEMSDGVEMEDADWEALRRQFTLLRDVVKDLDGQLQIIVSDHANLLDAWFQDSLVANWRKRYGPDSRGLDNRMRLNNW